AGGLVGGRLRGGCGPGGGPAGRAAGDGPADGRRPALPGRCGTGGRVRGAVGRPAVAATARSDRRDDRGSTGMSDAVLDYDQVLEQFDPVLGLAVHVELNTASKMFCGCATAFGAEPNTQTCPVCLGLPGSLPEVSAVAVASALASGLAWHGASAEHGRRERKNYSYPDMPKNYPISQDDEPIAYDGWCEVEVHGEPDRSEIGRAHMEEGTGKSLYVGGA